MPPVETRRPGVAGAVERLKHAEVGLARAQEALDEADARLDEELQAAGWTRFHGAFGPETRLYTHVSAPMTPLPRQEVLAAVAFGERPA
jgi:hypothetical protein